MSTTPRTDAARTIADSAIRASMFELIALQTETENARLRAALVQCEAVLDPDSDYVVQEAADCEVTIAAVKVRILDAARAVLAGVQS